MCVVTETLAAAAGVQTESAADAGSESQGTSAV